MNEVSCHFIGRFVVVYFDDILIYNRSLIEHLNHLCAIFYALHVKGLGPCLGFGN